MRRALAFLLLAGCGSGEAVSGYARVIDGDTLSIVGEHIRLADLDAPETLQQCRNDGGLEYPCGKWATVNLRSLIAGREVTCIGDHRDLYGRLVAHCTVNGADIGAWLVTHGWAVAAVKYGTEYQAAEMQARQVRAGIWSGEFEWPWDWRRSHSGI